MADTYGVAHAEISAELPGYFPGGFDATSRPSAEQVTGAISTADTIIGLAVQDVVGSVPSASDKAAALAKRYIIEWVKAWVIRTALGGRDPLQVDLIARPYEALAVAMRDALTALGSQAVGTGEPSSRVITSIDSTGLPARELLITDADLDPCARGRF